MRRVQRLLCVVNTDNEVSLVAIGGLVVSVLQLDPRVAGSNLAEGHGFLMVKKSVAQFPSEVKENRRSHVVRFYGM
jgi:hypothetical protein